MGAFQSQLMTKITLDKNGIPRLSANEIEMKAEEVIEFFDPRILKSSCQTPLMNFIQETCNRFNVGLDLSQDLGISPQGHKIMGMYCFHPRKILIDKSLKGDNRINFILGHEFGHLVLHRDAIIKKKGYSDVDISDTVRDFVTNRKKLLTNRDWIEWQANRFASSILIPRATLIMALLSVQKSLGINHNLGYVYLDQMPYSLRDFNQTLQKLQIIYHVTKKNVEYRLNELGILIDQRNKDTKHISELLSEK